MEIRADIKQYKIDGEKLDDAISDLMMSMGGNVKLFVGESFIEVSEEFATECQFSMPCDSIRYSYFIFHRKCRLQQEARRGSKENRRSYG